MELLITDNAKKAKLIQREIKSLLEEDRNIIILVFEPLNLASLNLRSIEGAEKISIINSIVGEESKAIMIMASLLTKYKGGIVDEIYGRYVIEASSSSKYNILKLQRKYIFLVSLLRYMEILNNSKVITFTSVKEPEEWFIKLFDQVSYNGGSRHA